MADPVQAKERHRTKALPDDILRRVMSTLYESTGIEVLRCMEVCKQWNSVVPEFIASATLTQRSRSLARFVESGKFTNLTTLKLDRCRPEEDGWGPLFESLGRNLTQLSTLHLVKLRPRIDPSEFTTLFRGCTRLRSLHIESCTLTRLPLVDAPPLVHLAIHTCTVMTPGLDPLLNHKAALRLECALAKLLSLETLDLHGHMRVAGVPDFRSLSNLRELKLSRDPRRLHLETVPCMSHLRTLDILEFSRCGECGPLPNLTLLPHLDTLGVTFRSDQHPQLLASLTSLTRLHLFDDANVSQLGLPPTLKSLSLELGFRYNVPFPPLVGLTSLTFLELNLANMPSPPPEVVLESLMELEELRLLKCLSTEAIALPPTTTLRRLTLRSCSELRSLAGNNAVEGLRELTIADCSRVDELASLRVLSEVTSLTWTGDHPPGAVFRPDQLRDLRKLHLEHLRLAPGPRGLASLTRLEHLHLCEMLEVFALSDLSCPGDLRTLEIERCPALRDISTVSMLRGLEVLKLHGLSVESLPSLDGLTALRKLSLKYNDALVSLPPLHGLSSLRELTLKACPELTSIPPLDGLTKLRALKVQACRQLADSPSAEGMNEDIEIIFES